MQCDFRLAIAFFSLNNFISNISTNLIDCIFSFEFHFKFFVNDLMLHAVVLLCAFNELAVSDGKTFNILRFVLFLLNEEKCDTLSTLPSHNVHKDCNIKWFSYSQYIKLISI